MIDEIMSLAVGNGIWTALFCFLFVYMLKDTHNREAKYNALIKSLGEQLDKTTSALDICKEIKSESSLTVVTSAEIKSNIERIKEGVDALRSTRERL